MGKTKGKGGGGKISSVKRNNKNVTKLERQGKLNRKAGKRAAGSGGKGGGAGKKSPLDKKVARLKESEKAHSAAIRARRQEEATIRGEEEGGEEEEEVSEGDEEGVSAKDLKDFGNSSFSLLSG